MALLQIVCCYSPQARQMLELTLTLEAGSTVEQALAKLAAHWQWPEGAITALGIWGRRVPVSQVLKNGDRLELYRALRVDPKVARRQRFKRQGAKRSGLFANRRPGAVPGY